MAFIAGGTEVGGSSVPPRNILINGAMTIAQRGTTSTSSGYKTVDRFRNSLSSGGAWTQSQSTDSPAGFANSYKQECTTAETDMENMSYAMVYQKIEGQLLQHLDFGTASPKKITLSFWVKSSLTGTHVCQLHAPYIETTEYNSHAYTVNVANTWEYKTITWTGDTGDVIPNDNSSSLRVYWFLAVGNGYGSGTLTNDLWHTTTANRAAGQVNLAGTVGNTFYLTGTQLEIGEAASPFEHRGYGDELAKCQRYYYLVASGNGVGGSDTVGLGTYYVSDQIYGAFFTKQTMRVQPTLEVVTGSSYYKLYSNGQTDMFSGLLTQQAGTNCFFWYSAGMSGTAGHAGWIRTMSTESKVALQAEL